MQSAEAANCVLPGIEPRSLGHPACSIFYYTGYATSAPIPVSLIKNLPITGFKFWGTICDVLAYGAMNKFWPTWWRKLEGWVKTNMLNSRIPCHVLIESWLHGDRKLTIMYEITLFWTEHVKMFQFKVFHTTNDSKKLLLYIMLLLIVPVFKWHL